MGFSNMMMAAAKSMPKSTMTQSMPSRTYSSCSTKNMWWLKNCCSFSFTKLMEICSKPLYSKISKPAMSSTAQKLAFFMVASIRVVTLDDQPLEDPVEDGTGNTSGGHGGLLAGLTLGHPLGSDLDPGLAECLEEGLWVNTKGSCGLAREGLHAHVGDLSLVVTALGLVGDATAGHNTGGQHVAVELLLLSEAQDIEGILSVEKLLIVVNGVDLGLTLGDI